MTFDDIFEIELTSSIQGPQHNAPIPVGFAGTVAQKEMIHVTGLLETTLALLDMPPEPIGIDVQGWK